MIELLDRPLSTTSRLPQDGDVSPEALWIIDILAEELAADATLDREELIHALLRRCGYEQADCLTPGDAQTIRAALVARLAGRLARG